jgi:hypothetical protein
MRSLEDPTHCVKRFDRFDSTFALFPGRTHLSNVFRSDSSCLGAEIRGVWSLNRFRCEKIYHPEALAAAPCPGYCHS